MATNSSSEPSTSSIERITATVNGVVGETSPVACTTILADNVSPVAFSTRLTLVVDGHWCLHYLGDAFESIVTPQKHSFLCEKARTFAIEQIAKYG